MKFSLSQLKSFITGFTLALLVLTTYQVQAARESEIWVERLSTYIETTWNTGRNVLINGTNKYLNFGSVSGSSGYGFRDNAGDMEYKDSGGGWVAFNSISGGGGGGITSLNGLIDGTQTFAVGTSSNVGITIMSSAGVHTFTPTVASGYSIPLTASSTNWQTAYTWGDHSLANYFDFDLHTTDDISEGTVQFFTGERAQDAVGGILTDSSTVDFTYNDAGNIIQASIITTGDWTGTVDGNNFAGGAIGAGDMLYGSGAGSIAELAIGASSTILTNNGSTPLWATGPSLCVAITGSAALCDGDDAAGSGGGSISTSTVPTPGQLAHWTSTSALGSIATGTLTETVSGLEFDQTRGLVGGAAVLSLSSGYTIPLSASTTEWSNFYVSPSTRITAGDALTWSGNTLNFDGGNTPGGELGGTWASPTLDDSVAVTSWNLTTPTLTSFFGTPCTGNEFLQDISDTGAFTCVEAASSGGGGGALSTTTDIVGDPLGTPQAASYVTGDVMFGGSASTTAEFQFDDDGAQLIISSSSLNATATIESSNNAQAVRLGVGSATTSAAGYGIEFDFNTVGDAIMRAYGTVTEFVFNLGVQLTGVLKDSTGSAGSSGMLLQSTGTSTLWIATSTLNIPSVASSTEWAAFYATPSSRITAGTGLFWTGNTISAMLSTSTALANTQVIYGTGAATVGSEAAFTYDSSADKLTTVNASTTNLTVATTLYLFGSTIWDAITDVRDYVWSTLTGGTGITFSSGDISFDCSEVEGTGINCTGEAVTLDATGDWTGTLDGVDGSAYAQAGGDTYTGTHDMGGAVLEIPNGAAPVADDPGEIAHDTSDNQLIVDDFVMARAVQRIWGVTVASTSPALTTGGLLKVPTELDGYTMTAIRCSVQGGTSQVIAIEDESANSTEDITCTTSVTSDDGSITNASVTAAEEMYIDFGATSGSVDYVTISVFGTITRE